MAAPDPLVLVDRPRPDIAVVTLNRPDKLNALSFALVDDLHASLDELQLDNTCRVVVLTGAGRGFCSGLDLTNIEGSSTSSGTTGPRGCRCRAGSGPSCRWGWWARCAPACGSA